MPRNKKVVEARLIKALDRNDSKVVREACITLKAMESENVDNFFKKYYLNIDGNGFIINQDSSDEFNMKYLPLFIQDYLGLAENDKEKISDFYEKIKQKREEAKTEANKSKETRGYNPYIYYKKEFYLN